MTDETGAPVAEAAPADFAHSPAGNEPLTPREAARSLADARYKRAAEQNKQAEQPAQAEAPPANELADEANAAPPSEATGETTENEPAETQDDLPPIEPPRSWTKEKKEAFASLPRDLQEYVAESAKRQDTEFRRSQNEAAEQRKAIEAERQKAEKVRQEYEAKLPQMFEVLRRTDPFPDVQSLEDAEKLSSDEFRYWQIHQWRMQTIQHEIKQAEARKASEEQSKFAEFAKEQDAKFIELVPEFSDKDKASNWRGKTVDYLTDLGFSEQELAASWHGQEKFSLRDARLQKILLDAAKFNNAQREAQKVKAKPLPPAQRPGVAKAQGADSAQKIQALEQQLAKASGLQAIRIGAEITKLKRAG